MSVWVISMQLKLEVLQNKTRSKDKTRLHLMIMISKGTKKLAETKDRKNVSTSLIGKSVKGW